MEVAAGIYFVIIPGIPIASIESYQSPLFICLEIIHPIRLFRAEVYHILPPFTPHVKEDWVSVIISPDHSPRPIGRVAHIDQILIQPKIHFWGIWVYL